MTLKIAKIALGTLLLTFVTLTLTSTTTWGKDKPRVLAIENKCGLEVKVPAKTVDLGNLNPGDNKKTKLEISNTGSNDMTVYIRTNIVDETTLNGGYLADITDYVIKDGERIIADDLFRNVALEGNLLIGTLKPGTSKTLDFFSYLPGDGTGNDYQRAYMKVSWTFITQCSGITIEDEEIPFDGSKLPQTGQLNLLCFYGIGAFLMILGIVWLKRGDGSS